MKKLSKTIAKGKMNKQQLIFVAIVLLVLCMGGLITFKYAKKNAENKDIVQSSEEKKTATTAKKEEGNPQDENTQETNTPESDKVETIETAEDTTNQLSENEADTKTVNKNTSSTDSANNQVSNTTTNAQTAQPEEDTSASEEVFVKGPKPAKYSVVQAYDFPNDFPSDGWSWHYSTYVWTPQHVFWAWDEERGYYVGDIEWVVALRSTTSNTDISLAPETIENVKKLMVPAPTLEQSQELVKEGDNFFYIRYGAINVYVCMEE